MTSAIAAIHQFPIDREAIPQARLDLASRNRTSLFPWRGQFSPELIEILLSEYVDARGIVADPFAGSGTTLFEAARRLLTCFGAEINPAAVEMGSTVHFVNMQKDERAYYVRKAQDIVEKYAPYHGQLDLFSLLHRGDDVKGLSFELAVRKMLYEAKSAPLVHNIVANTVIRYLMPGNRQERTFFRAFCQHKAIVDQLPYTENVCKMFHSDARSLPIARDTVDFIVTSPPYINVFNYHQNYRRAMELMGWDLLAIAKSEIGSNRKNRGNRFLTVVQYAIDMLQALCEMRRIIRPEGRIVIVIGRESKVRGVSFQDGQVIAALATGGAGLQLILRQERRFLNRFGEEIYEDLLHFRPAGEPQHAFVDFARSVAQDVLHEAAAKAEHGARKDIMAAIQHATSVEASPVFQYQGTNL